MIECNNPDHGRVIASLTSTPFTPGLDMSITRSHEGKLLGGVIYQNYMTRSIVIHVASFARGWLTRDLLWAIFDYPFNRLKVEKILGFVPSTNRRALDFDMNVGFTIAAVIPDVVSAPLGEQGDLVVLSMTRAECRWLGIVPKNLAHVVPAREEKAAA